MSDAPSKFTLRPLRYVEPGSDSPWKEVFGTQEDGTHRPQYYSQLELPKILETLRKNTKTWLSPELSIVLSRLALWLQRPEKSDAQVQALKELSLRTRKESVGEAQNVSVLQVSLPKVSRGLASTLLNLLLQASESSSAEVNASSALEVESRQSSSASISAEVYYVTLFFIFLNSEGKALARAALKLYTNPDASGNVVSSFKLDHFKGFVSEASSSAISALELTRLLDTSAGVVCSCRLSSFPSTKASAPEVLDSSMLSVTKPLSAGTACQALVDVFYLGYGIGFYGLGPYGV